MKTKFLIITTILSIVFTSCKKEADEKKEEAATPKVEKNDNFTVEMSVIADKDDNFAVYYTEDNTINFTGEKALWTGVKGQAESQKIVFDFKDAIVPTDIRFDFGLEKTQGDVILENFKCSFYGKNFEAKGADFYKYFIENKDVESQIDATKGTITFKKAKGEFKTPFFYPQQALLDQIALITK